MPSVPSPCRSHPERATTRRCFTCKEAICKECTLHRDRHYFCGPACQERWAAERKPTRRKKTRPRKTAPATARGYEPAGELREAAAKAASVAFAGDPKAAAGHPMPPERLRTPFVIRQSAAPAPGRLWLAALTVANLAALVAILYYVGWPAPAPAPHEGWREIAELNQVLRGATAPLAAPVFDAAPLETTAATAIVSGDAQGAEKVRILFNGAEVAATAVAGGRFQSEPLVLDYGLNVVQAAGLDETGTPHYSLALLVRRRDVPPPVEHSVRIELPVGRDIDRGNTARKAVSFTFDGGSGANAADEILTLLQAKNIRTTLFLTGEFIKRHPDVVRRAVADGHEIANHTFSHPHLTTFELNARQELREGIDEIYLAKQLGEAAKAFEFVTGKKMAPYWRAPYGEINSQLRAWAERAGYRHVGWTRHVGPLASLDSLDWVEDRESRLYVTGAEFKRRFVQVAANETDALRGGIFLMHLGTDRKTDKLHWQLDEILQTYRRLGFAVVPISELIR